MPSKQTAPARQAAESMSPLVFMIFFISSVKILMLSLRFAQSLQAFSLLRKQPQVEIFHPRRHGYSFLLSVALRPDIGEDLSALLIFQVDNAKSSLVFPQSALRNPPAPHLSVHLPDQFLRRPPGDDPSVFHDSVLHGDVLHIRDDVGGNQYDPVLGKLGQKIAETDAFPRVQPLVGSSRPKISGSLRSAWAMPTRRFMPPESFTIFLLRTLRQRHLRKELLCLPPGFPFFKTL